MRFLLTALLFFSAVVVFTLIAKVVYQGSVEAEWERQAALALRNAGFEGVVVSFDHHEAEFSGYVDSDLEVETVQEIIAKAIPVARISGTALTGIAIRPTVPPELTVESAGAGENVMVSGVLGSDGEGVRALLGSRLAAVAGGKIDHRITLDATRLPLATAAEFAATAVELVKHSLDAEIRLRENQVILRGTVPNDGIKEGILELAGKIAAPPVDDEISVVDPRSFLRRSTLSLTRNRFGVTLSGSRASTGERGDVAGILRESFPSLPVNDRRTSAEDRVPGTWEGHAGTALPSLLDLLVGEMTVEFSENQIRLTGVTTSRENREAILAAIQPVLAENGDLEVLADLTIETAGDHEGPPSYLAASYVEGLLTLEGRVNDDSFVAKMEEELVAVFPDLLVKNALSVDPAAVAAAWPPKLPVFFAEALARVEEGSFRFSNATVRLEGTTREITDKAILQNVAVNTAPPGYRIENELIHPDEPFPTPELLPEVREKLAESLKQFPVYFDSNSEIVNAEGRDKVQAVATLLKETGGKVPLLATGFADNVGNAENNRQLSLRRAAAVVAALAALEIPGESLTTASKVEDVAGIPRSERWKARRVEISLLPESDAAALPPE